MSQQTSEQTDSQLINAVDAAAPRGVHIKTFIAWKIPQAIAGRRGRGRTGFWTRASVEALTPPERGREQAFRAPGPRCEGSSGPVGPDQSSPRDPDQHR